MTGPLEPVILSPHMFGVDLHLDGASDLYGSDDGTNHHESTPDDARTYADHGPRTGGYGNGDGVGEHGRRAERRLPADGEVG
jgi:hypothetical protein